MQEEQPGLLVQHVAVDRRHLDADTLRLRKLFASKSKSESANPSILPGVGWVYLVSP
jgi:hypothetical protein